MEPVSLKPDLHVDIEDIPTQIVSSPLKKQLKKETMMLSKPASIVLVHISLTNKLKVDLPVLNNCCLVIGRAPSPPENVPQYTLLALDSGQISRTHVALFMEEGNLFIQDMGSSNGSFITIDDARQKLEPQKPVAFTDQAIVEFGDAVLKR